MATLAARQPAREQQHDDQNNLAGTAQTYVAVRKEMGQCTHHPTDTAIEFEHAQWCCCTIAFCHRKSELLVSKNSNLGSRDACDKVAAFRKRSGCDTAPASALASNVQHVSVYADYAM